MKALENAISSLKAIHTLADYYGEHFREITDEMHIQNLKHIMELSQNALKLLQEVDL